MNSWQKAFLSQFSLVKRTWQQPMQCKYETHDVTFKWDKKDVWQTSITKMGGITPPNMTETLNMDESGWKCIMGGD